MTTAIIYLRVSTEEQETNFSIPSQRRACEAYCQTNSYDVLAEYTDTFTGTTLDRPALSKLLDRIGEFDVLVVHSVSRLSRDPADLLHLHKRLLTEGVRVEYVNEPVDSSTDIGEAVLYFQGFAAKQWRKLFLESIRRGKRGKVQSGKVLPVPVTPYGYTYDAGREMYVINEAEADIVRKIFQWYVVGDEYGKRLSTYVIAARLTDMGIPTRYDSVGRAKGKNAGVWNAGVVGKMLNNTLYTGVWRWGAGQEGGKKNRKQDYVAVQIPAIIDAAIFIQVKDQADKNRWKALRRTIHFYLMQKHMICESCGRSMSAHTKFDNGREYPYYRCSGVFPTHATDGKTATCKSGLPAANADQKIWVAVRQWLENPEQIHKMLLEKYERDFTASTALRRDEEQAGKRVGELNQKLEKLLDLYLDGQQAKEKYERKEAELREQLRSAEGLLLQTRRRLAAVKNEPPSVMVLQRMCANILERMVSSTQQQRRTVIELLDIQGTVSKDRKQIRLAMSIEAYELELLIYL